MYYCYWGKENHSLYRGLHYIEVHYNEVSLFPLYGEGGFQGFFFFWGVWHFSLEGFYPTPVSEPINLLLEIDNKQLPIKWECLPMKSTLCNAGHSLNQGTNSGPPRCWFKQQYRCDLRLEVLRCFSSPAKSTSRLFLINCLILLQNY